MIKTVEGTAGNANPAIGVVTRDLAYAPDSLGLFARLADSGARHHSVLLESAKSSGGGTQRSILATANALRVTCRGAAVSIEALSPLGLILLFLARGELDIFSPVSQGDSRLLLSVPIPARSPAVMDGERLRQESSLSVLRNILSMLSRFLGKAQDSSAFLSGVFSYDLVEQFERLPDVAPDGDFPDYCFYLAEELVEIDHVAGSAKLSALYCGDMDLAQARLDVLEQAAGRRFPSQAVKLPTTSAVEDACANESDDAFAARVEQIKTHIIKGDVFQIVPSRTFSLPCGDPFAAYRSLRTLNPSPYLFYVHAGTFVLFGASPESSVKVTASGRDTRSIEISPIAGTRPRARKPDGAIDMDLDGRMEAELRLDAKETAEHIMLVDLARNDVARVSKPGTRHVVDLMHVERYSHVMHLVSRVCGELRGDLDALHAYQAAMNMGTLTGSPKIRAMQLLREYGEGRRNYYGGAVGYLRGSGDMDTAIVIRTALVVGDIAYIRAGAGVVHDSVPMEEARETRRKAAAVIQAIQTSQAFAKEDVA